MNLATATVTVYFVGLMNVYTPPSPSTVKRELIVPLATSETTAHASVQLKRHDAYILIRGLSRGTLDCTSLDGTWKDRTCSIGPILSGKWITLPTTAVTFAASTRNPPPPKITGQCRGVKLDPAYLTDDSKYAVRLSVTHGFLSSCTNHLAMIPYLTLKDSSGKLTISGKCKTDPAKTCPVTVTLNHGAVVYIINSPAPAEERMDERQHFFWYYKMFVPPAGTVCKAFPKVAWVGTPCNPEIPHVHNLNVQSGTNCTATGYP